MSKKACFFKAVMYLDMEEAGRQKCGERYNFWSFCLVQYEENDRYSENSSNKKSKKKE